MMSEMRPRLGVLGLRGKERFIGKLEKRTLHSLKNSVKCR